MTIGVGAENLSADFGYNWQPPSNTCTPQDPNCIPPMGAPGAIGDRVWVDSNGNGAQEPWEIGIPGVKVTLLTPGPDGLFGTGDDVMLTMAVTNATGNYIFNNLPAGAYVVQVDPTHAAGRVHADRRPGSLRDDGSERQPDHDADRAGPGRRVPECRLRLPADGRGHR